MMPSMPNSNTAPQRNLRGDILFVFILAIVLYTAWHLREVLILLYVSALFAVILSPVVSSVMRLRIGRWQPSRSVAILLLVLGLLLLAAIFLMLTLPPLIRDLTNFAQDIPQRSAAIVHRMQHLTLLKKIDLASLTAKLQLAAARDTGDVLDSLSNWAARLLSILSGMVLTVYLLIEGKQVYGWFLQLVPPARRHRLDATLQQAAVRMGGWLLGQLMLMLILAVTSGIVLRLLHVRYALTLAVLLGVSNIIPVVGALFTGSLALLAAAMDSWTKLLSVLAFGLVYAQIENAYLTPRIMRTRVNLTGTAILIALILGFSLAGVAGALVAVPTAVLVAVLVEEYVTYASEDESQQDAPRSPDNLLS